MYNNIRNRHKTVSTYLGLFTFTCDLKYPFQNIVFNFLIDQAKQSPILTLTVGLSVGNDQTY